MNVSNLTKFLLVLVIGSLSQGKNLRGILPTPAEIQNSIQLQSEIESLIQSVTTSDPNFNVSSIDPVKVELPGGGFLDLTAAYWPLQQICPPKGIIANLGCMLCQNDCIFTHNRFGGSCRTGGICVCNVRAPTGGAPFTDVVGTCGALTGNAKTDNKIDLEIKKLVRGRGTQYQKCVPQSDSEIPQSESLGCNSDCKFVHGFKSGRCIHGATPVATYPGETRPGFYCGCFN